MPSFLTTTIITAPEVLDAGQNGLVSTSGQLLVSANAITVNGSAELMVLGSVVARSGIAVRHTAGNLDFTNAGTISATSDAINSSSGESLRLANSGTILSQADVVDYRQGSSGFVSVVISNSGTLQGQSDGIVLGMLGGTATITNTGFVIGGEGRGIAMDVGATSADATGVVTIVNSGVIMGGDGAILGDVSALRVFNSGLLEGEVVLSDKGDLYSGRLGEVSGPVTGNAGNDTLLGGAGGEVMDGGGDSDSISGGAGDDQLLGGEGFDTLRGDDGDDTLDGGDSGDGLFGGRGDDEINGGEGNDNAAGGADADLILADAGNDNVRGQDGDDVLFGGAGNDTVQGGEGDDLLYGDAGRDLLIGGTGSDDFIYLAIADSPNTAESDTIRDFEQGLDLIDLRDVSAQVMGFAGTGAFAGGGVASVRFQINTNGTTRITVDADGNGVADMRLNLVGEITLTAGDFLL